MTDIHCEGDYRRVEAENRRLHERIEELEYDVLHWKREACQLVDSDRTNLIQQQFDLTAEEAIICNALHRRGDKWLPGNTIEGLLDEYRGGSTEASLVSQMVSRIRRKLGVDVIENARGRGYRMSPGMLKRFNSKIA